MKPTEIIEKLNKTDLRLDAILDFLHECQLNGTISKNTNFLEIAKVDIGCLGNKEINDLPEIRDNLLNQLNN